MASVWGLVALCLADEEFLPFDNLSYAKELQVYVHFSLLSWSWTYHKACIVQLEIYLVLIDISDDSMIVYLFICPLIGTFPIPNQVN